MTEIRESRTDTARADLDDLTNRLARTRWSDDLPGARDDHGAPRARVRVLAACGQHGYDRRAWGKR
ncbi:epoxide hydrolase N-terminal domain-containing protein [Micromonospora sp. NPDC047644]|uniref:epoxide hydrolase N-terminal domain-containing protein n=1 Tax=Micromonospora sp. NPDC047644 TaxID=3157203 RepID=UPI003451B263